MTLDKEGASLIERILALIGTPFLIFLLVLVIILVWVFTNLSAGVNPVLVSVAILMVVVMFAGFGFILELQKRRLDDQKRRLDYQLRTIEALKHVLRDRNEPMSGREIMSFAEDPDAWKDR